MDRLCGKELRSPVNCQQGTKPVSNHVSLEVDSPAFTEPGDGYRLAKTDYKLKRNHNPEMPI